MQPQVIVAGHICLDIIPGITSTTPLDPGKLIRVGSADLSTGGAVANVGLALHRLGVPVRLMGAVADDLFGRAILDLLRTHDPSLAGGMRLSTDGSTSYTIVISPPDRDRIFLHCPGLNQTFTPADVSFDQIPPARIFHFGYPPVMPAMCVDDGRPLAEMFHRVQAMGVLTSLDMCMPDPAGDAGRVNWERLLASVLPAVDVFLPSFTEMLFMLDRDAFERGDRDLHEARISRICDRLLAMGPTVVGLKLGDQGLFVKTAGDKSRFTRWPSDANAWAGKTIHSPCFKAKWVAGTTGSGDATIAGFLASIGRGCGVVDAAINAAAVGACSVEAIDATSGIPNWQEIERRLRSAWPRLPLRFPPTGFTRTHSGTFYLEKIS